MNAMFTGIVRHVGTVLRAEGSASVKTLLIDLGPVAKDLRKGDSVAVAGTCLTVSELSERTARFDVVAETLSRTTLKDIRAGEKVNLERALRLDQALDGHWIQGHVDGMAQVLAIHTGEEYRIDFEAPAELTDQMVPKGSVAVDGVSLTLLTVTERTFSVALIPVTLKETTLGGLVKGDRVNVETDIIGKYVLKYLKQLNAASESGRITIEQLKRAGFA